MTLHEMRELMENKKLEARGLIDSDFPKAEELVKEARELEKKIKLQEELEAEEERDLEKQKESRKGGEDMNKVNEMRALTKKVLGHDLTEEERAVIKMADNAALFPKEYINQIEEIKKGFGSLKSLCDVIPVTKNEGSKPVVDLDQNEIVDVVEGDAITEGSLVTTDVQFKCAKVGLLNVLSSESVDDAEIDIQNLVEKNFAEIAVRNENARILKVLKDNATLVEGTDYTAIENVMDTAVPAVRAGLVTLCNTAGYADLKNAKDAQKRPLNLITVINGQEYFNNKPLYVFDDSLVTLTEGKTKLFFSVAMKEGVKFFDRKQISIARAEKFENDTKMVRVLERIDVKKGTIRSLKKIEY